MRINSYSSGTMVIGGAEYKGDVIVLDDRVITDWHRQDPGLLSLEDLEAVVDFLPQILVIGKGDVDIIDIPLAAKMVLDQRNIQLVAGKTQEVWHLYNDFLEKGKKVAGVFHLA